MCESIYKINSILSRLRVPIVDDEYELQNKIEQLFIREGVKYHREYVLGPRNRVDFLTHDGIAIEVKKGKPNKQMVIRQLDRYTKFNIVSGIILVVETSLVIPKVLNNKPCISFGLNKLWGIAL